MEKELLEKALDAGGRRTIHITPASIFSPLCIKEEAKAGGFLFRLLDDEGAERTLTLEEWKTYLSINAPEEETAETKEEAEAIIRDTMLPITGTVPPLPEQIDEEEEEAGADALCFVVEGATAREFMEWCS